MILPYLELPVAIGYDGQADKTVKGKFQPSQIQCYHEGYYDVGIFVYFGGQVVQVALTIEVFEAQLMAYWSAVNHKATIKDKLRMVQ